MSSALPAAQRMSDPHVAPDGPAVFLEPLQERREAGLAFGIGRSQGHQHADAPHPLRLLRVGR
jgi:hypothetical protein